MQEVKSTPYKYLTEAERYLRYKETHQANRIKNRERRRLMSQKWHKDNRDHAIEYRQKWCDEHRQEISDYSRKYRETLRGKLSHRNNSRKRYRPNDRLTLELTQRVYEDNIKKYGTLTCILCCKTIEFGQDSIEHLTPLIRGGTNEYNNLGVSHKNCNCKKHTKTLEEWRILHG